MLISANSGYRQIDIAKLILNGSGINYILLTSILRECTNGCPIKGGNLIKLFLELNLLHGTFLVEMYCTHHEKLI